MTHSLHRIGDAEALGGDFVLFAMSAKGINASGSAEQLRQFCQVVERHGPVNRGDMRTGNGYRLSREVLHSGIRDNSIVHYVFDQRQPVERALAELRALDLGISVVVSGLFDQIEETCCGVGLEPHSIARSLGVHGKRSRLPELEILELTTMCGHGMVAAGLARKQIEEVRQGDRSPEEAAAVLARPCHCGIFNPRRAELLLRR